MHTQEIHDRTGQISDHDGSGQGRGVAGQPVVSPGSEEKRPRLIGTLARALRHEPEQYGIELDAGGWADLGALVDHLRRRGPCWAWLSEREVLRLLEADAANRFEYADGRIRAVYGHSVSGVRVSLEQAPPPDLYHATGAYLLPTILHTGLKPMGRSHVHLTSDRSYATRLGSAKFIRWVLLGVNVKEAVKGGVRFLRANRHVWQTAYVEARLLDVLQQHDNWASGENVGGTSKHYGDDRTSPVPSRTGEPISGTSAETRQHDPLDWLWGHPRTT